MTTGTRIVMSVILIAVGVIALVHMAPIEGTMMGFSDMSLDSENPTVTLHIGEETVEGRLEGSRTNIMQTLMSWTSEAQNVRVSKLISPLSQPMWLRITPCLKE